MRGLAGLSDALRESHRLPTAGLLQFYPTVASPWAAPSNGRVIPRGHPAQRQGETILADFLDNVSIAGHIFLSIDLGSGQVLMAQDELCRFRTELAANLRPRVVP